MCESPQKKGYSVPTCPMRAHTQLWGPLPTVLPIWLTLILLTHHPRGWRSLEGSGFHGKHIVPETKGVCSDPLGDR